MWISLLLPARFRRSPNLFAGAASGEFALDSSGATRADLVSSLECRGNARISRRQAAKYQSPGVHARRETAPRRERVSRSQSAVFACGNGKIIFQRLRFTGAAQDVAASGSVDFSRDLRSAVARRSGCRRQRAATLRARPCAALRIDRTGSLPELPAGQSTRAARRRAGKPGAKKLNRRGMRATTARVQLLPRQSRRLLQLNVHACARRSSRRARCCCRFRRNAASARIHLTPNSAWAKSSATTSNRGPPQLGQPPVRSSIPKLLRN